jgi:hypothetical protein
MLDYFYRAYDGHCLFLFFSFFLLLFPIRSAHCRVCGRRGVVEPARSDSNRKPYNLL